MSMLDSLRSKLGIDPDADSYVDDTEENVFPGGQGVAAAQEYTQQQEIKQHSNKVVNINATTQLQVVLVKPERFDDASSIADQLNAKHTVVLNLESASKEVSRRPQSGLRLVFRPGPSRTETSCAAASSPMARPISSPSAGSQLQATVAAVGKQVAGTLGFSPR